MREGEVPSGSTKFSCAEMGKTHQNRHRTDSLEKELGFRKV